MRSSNVLPSALRTIKFEMRTNGSKDPEYERNNRQETNK